MPEHPPARVVSYALWYGLIVDMQDAQVGGGFRQAGNLASFCSYSQMGDDI